MMKYVVTGGAGFIGSNLVDRLIKDDNEVHVIDNFLTGKKENCNPDAIYHNIDISNHNYYNKMLKILKKTDTVFHLACIARVQPSIQDPIKYELNNTIGLANILKASVDKGVRRFVYSSSSSVYGDISKPPQKEDSETNPMSPYGAQKLYGEILCKTFSTVYNIEAIALRYFNVYGEKQNMHGAYSLVIGIFLNQRFNNKPLTIRGDGKQKRDFTYVGDVVKANILAAKTEIKGAYEVFNIGNGDNRSINQVASYVGGSIKYIDAVKEPQETLADNKKAKKVLNWEPSQDVKSWITKYIEEINE